MIRSIDVREAKPDDGVLPGLAEVLIDCVDGGASVGFMRPFTHGRALAFWAEVLDRAAGGDVVVLVAEERDTGAVVGTVQVVLTMPENQPHRGEISKMLVHRRARRRGIGEALMRAAETAALDAGKRLLVLDTASGDAERLYHRLGWRRVGLIPGYALGPAGDLVATTIFYKDLTPWQRPSTGRCPRTCRSCHGSGAENCDEFRAGRPRPRTCRSCHRGVGASATSSGWSVPRWAYAPIG